MSFLSYMLTYHGINLPQIHIGVENYGRLVPQLVNDFEDFMFALGLDRWRE